MMRQTYLPKATNLSSICNLWRKTHVPKAQNLHTIFTCPLLVNAELIGLSTSNFMLVHQIEITHQSTFSSKVDMSHSMLHRHVWSRKRTPNGTSGDIWLYEN